MHRCARQQRCGKQAQGGIDAVCRMPMILRRHARQEAFTQVSRGERTRESGIYSAWRQNDSNHAHSVSDADALVALWRSRLAHESSRSRATSVAKREQSRCAAMPQWKWTLSFCRRPAPNSSHAAPAYRKRARSAMLRLHLSHKATGEIKLNRQARSHVLRVS